MEATFPFSPCPGEQDLEQNMLALPPPQSQSDKGPKQDLHLGLNDFAGDHWRGGVPKAICKAMEDDTPGTLAHRHVEHVCSWDRLGQDELLTTQNGTEVTIPENCPSSWPLKSVAFPHLLGCHPGMCKPTKRIAHVNAGKWECTHAFNSASILPDCRLHAKAIPAFGFPNPFLWIGS